MRVFGPLCALFLAFGVDCKNRNVIKQRSKVRGKRDRASEPERDKSMALKILKDVFSAGFRGRLLLVSIPTSESHAS